MLKDYVLQLADNALILGHRLSEWCGHGPILEQDIALTNIALDLVGQARYLYQYAAKIEGGDKTEDYYPFNRDVLQWKNVLLVETENKDFAHTIVRQFLYDVFDVHFLTALQSSSDETLKAIATKTLKESRYHLQYSKDWMLRLGDGTEESHSRMQEALDNLYVYFGELFEASEIELKLVDQNIAVDLKSIEADVRKECNSIIQESTLEIKEIPWHQSGGKQGRHTEKLGFLLTELQYMQRVYPNMQW